MKQHNRVKRLRVRQAAYENMLLEASGAEGLLLAKAFIRPGSLKK